MPPSVTSALTGRDGSLTAPTPEPQDNKSDIPIPPGQPVTVSSQPSMEEFNLVSKCKQFFMQARAGRQAQADQWVKNYKVLANRTWSDLRPTWLPSPEVPEIYPILASIVGWMTDQRPHFEVIPFAIPNTDYYQYYQELGNTLQAVMDSSWYNNATDSQVELVVWDGLVCGTGIFKTTWDNSLVSGIGDAVVTRVDPFAFYPDPAATSMQDAQYFIEARTMSVQEMDRRYPGSAAKVTPIDLNLQTQPDPLKPLGSQPKANPGAISPSTLPSYGLPGQSNRLTATDDPGVTVLECWLREHEQTTNPETNLPTVKERWRLVVIAGERVLVDTYADQLWSHGMHPYDRFVPHANGRFWGYSMVEWLAPSQRALNRLLADMQYHVELTGNPVLVENKRAGISRTQITNKPGQRVLMNDGGEATWLNPPPFAQQALQLIEFYVTEMERISGLSAISRGMAPGGRNAQGVMDSLQESSFVRVRLSLRNLEYALRDAGNKYASLICEYYTEPRMVAIVGPAQQPGVLALRSQHFYTATDSGRIPMRFQIKVEAGSQLATSRMARIAEADTLFAMGAVDEIAVLEAHNFPNWPKVAERVMTMKAQGLMQPPGARQRTRS